MTETIGFIGLGSMGRPMANNLLAAGFDLRIYNRTPGKAVDLIASGARAVVTPVERLTIALGRWVRWLDRRWPVVLRKE